MGIKTTINIDSKTVDEIICKYISEKYNILTRTARFGRGALSEDTTMRTYWDESRNVTVVINDAPEEKESTAEFPFRVTSEEDE